MIYEQVEEDARKMVVHDDETVLLPGLRGLEARARSALGES
ncbi:MAG: hypothetical protein U5L11_16540 [Arhodomonas sp.]|nr:hypothetical protein [Arhodomonas sp.]